MKRMLNYKNEHGQKAQEYFPVIFVKIVNYKRHFFLTRRARAIALLRTWEGGKHALKRYRTYNFFVLAQLPVCPITRLSSPTRYKYTF